ncbi:MAG: dihydropteroate synthase, partial [Thermomicrobiales bacterium]
STRNARGILRDPPPGSVVILTMQTRHGAIALGERTQIMAIVNITPDSFSGDGIAGTLDVIRERVRQAEIDGATIVDLGAESTRPGHQAISAQEELDRLIPALITAREVTNLPISIDTMKAEVARSALETGADIINDIRGLTFDPEMAGLVAAAGVPIVIMHDATPELDIDFIESIKRELLRRVEIAAKAGVARNNIILDPGFGFGKSWHQNLGLLDRLNELKSLGFPILAGISRKRMIGWALGLPENERLEGTIATTVMAIERGADIIRVHDILPNARAAIMTDAVVRQHPVAPREWQ